MFDCVEFFVFARDCQRLFTSDAALRTAIGRAYYAAYHQAWLHGVAVQGKRFPSNGDAHGLVAAALREHNHELGQDLESLKRMRRRADYDLHYAGDQVADDAQSAIDLAGNLLLRIRVPSSS